MIQRLICFLLLGITFMNSSNAQSKEENNVAAAVENLRKAMLDGNKSVLEKLTCDELSYGHSTGKIEDKTAFVEALASGNSHFKSIELTNQTIKLAGSNNAIVRHVFKASLTDNGESKDVTIAILQVWQKQKSEWKLLARQAIKIQAP